MDHADRAQEGIDNALADALAKHHRTHPGPAPGNPHRRDVACYVSTKDRGPEMYQEAVICRDCEEAIDPRRLAAHPAATRCIDCQEEFERRSRR